MRNQIKFVFQIGLERPQARSNAGGVFRGQVIAAACELCGGCTTDEKAGWWCEDGASHADTFKGELDRETCFELELTCEEDKSERVYTALQVAIAEAAQRNAIRTEWVHVSETVMRGRHFAVSSVLSTTPAIAAE